MATYSYDGITLVIGGNEVIRAGDWQAWVLSYTGTPISEAYVYPLLQPPAATPGNGTEGVLGCVTVVAVGPAQGDSTTPTRIVPANDIDNAGPLTDAFRRAILGPLVTVSTVNSRGDLEALFGRGSEIVSTFDFMARERAARDAIRANEQKMRDAWGFRILADIERERERLPVTAAEIRTRLCSRPRPRRALADGRVAPQTYDIDEPLPLP